MHRRIICFLLSISFILNTLSVYANEKETENDASFYIAPVEYDDQKGNIENLSLMVIDNDVYVNAEQIAKRLGYNFSTKDGRTAISNTKDNSLPKTFIFYSVGKEEVIQLNNNEQIHYKAPCACKEVNGNVWVPFTFTLLMLNSSMLIQDNVLLIETPHKDLLDVFYDVFVNKDIYEFDFMTDFGYTDKDIGAIWGGSRLSTVWNGVLSMNATSWAALFQAFSDNDAALDAKYGKDLAILLCTESDEELKASTDNARAVSDLYEKGKLGKALQAKSDQYEEALEKLTKTGEEYLKEIKKGNSEYILKYNQNYKVMEEVFEKQDKFEKIGGNVLDVQKKMPIDMSYLEYASYLTELFSYANEFQNQDEFSVKAVSACVDINDNAPVLEKNVKSSVKKYTDSLKGNGLSYTFSNFLWNNIGDFAVNKTPIAEMFGTQANIELALWNIASNVIPFISNGLDGAEKFELALYASFFQDLMRIDYSAQYKNVISNLDNVTTYDDLYKLSQTCYTYIKSCYIARNAGIGSLIGKRKSVRESVQPLIDEQNTINKEITEILAEIKKVEETKRDNDSHVFGFLPSDNEVFLKENSDDSILDFLNNLSSKEDSEKPIGPSKVAQGAFISVINDTFSQYGDLRIRENEDGQQEAYGLCYLNLIDFNNDGFDELIIVCKNKEEEHYSCFIYQDNDGNADLIFNSEEIEYDEGLGCEDVYLSFCNDTGYVLGMGWEGDDADDMTFIWYKDGQFKPVYRYKGYWDGEKGEEVVEEDSTLVDLFDDDHIEEMYENRSMATLRTYSGYDTEEDYFDAHKLQKTIDDTFKKLGVKIENLPEFVTFSEARINELSEPALFNCIEKNLDRWVPDVNDGETFWDVMCFYCNFTDWINTKEYPRLGEDGQYNVIPNNVLKNAANAFFADFDGKLPSIGNDIWRAKRSDSDTTGVAIGDTSAFNTISQTYTRNKDGTLDAEYVLEYWGGTPAGSYKVHFEPNSQYNEIDGGVTYYYRVSYVEKTDGSVAETKFEISNSDDTDDERENGTEIDAFYAIIEEYREALNGNESLYNDSLNDEEAFKSVYPHVCAYAPTMAYAYNADLKYAYYDIDGNGSMELLIGGNPDSPSILDIIIYDGHEAHGCFTNEWIGERNALYVYNDGTIHCHGAGGAVNSVEDLYRISSDGYDIELINSFEADWSLYPDTPYFNDEEFLTPEEFNRVTVDLGYISPEWISFF